MKYLKTYKLFESINLDDYEDFISKWKKSGGYISRNTVKKMDEIGIKHEYFSKVKNDIDRCYSFFGKNDIELLSDLMLEVFDEVPSISQESANYSFGIKCASSKYDDHVNIGYPVSYNSEGKMFTAWEPSTHHHLMDKDVLLEKLIRTIIVDRENLITKEERDLEERIKKKDKHYYIGMSKATISHLKSTSPFRSLNVNPVIYIDTVVDGEAPVWPSSNTDWYMIRQNFMTYAKQSVIRYLSAIGYNLQESKVILREDGTHMAHQKRFRVEAVVNLS